VDDAIEVSAAFLACHRIAMTWFQSVRWDGLELESQLSMHLLQLNRGHFLFKVFKYFETFA
jgi:hypothetical protein